MMLSDHEQMTLSSCGNSKMYDSVSEMQQISRFCIIDGQ